MARKVLRRIELDAKSNGGSDYLLLERVTKEFLSQNLGEPFDPAKHKIIMELSMNKDGKYFSAFWFEPRG